MKKEVFMTILVIFSLNMPFLAHARSGEPIQNAKAELRTTDTPVQFDKEQKPGTRAKCPVFKSEFTIDKKTQKSEYRGRHYYFCCRGCKPEFDKDPERYLPKEDRKK